MVLPHSPRYVTLVLVLSTKSRYMEIYRDIYINTTIGCELEIKKELIILFDIEAGNLTKIFNLILLITKSCRYIYVCKCIGETPSKYGAIKKIKYVERLERQISRNNNQLYLHLKKWGKFAPEEL